MANQLGTLNVTVLVLKALERLRITHPQIYAFARNFSSATLKKGDTLSVKVASNATASVYTGGSFTAGDAILTDKTITIDTHLHATFSLSEDERAKGAQNWEEELINALVDAIASKIYSLIFTQLKTATVGAAVKTIADARQMEVALADFTRTSIVSMGTQMNKAKVSKAGRFAILSPEYYGKLFSDTSIVGALVNPGAGAAITEGTLPRIHGFATSEYTELQNTATPNFIEGIYGVNSAIGIVSALPVAPSQGGTAEVVTDPNSGLSLQVRRWGNFDTGADYVSVQALFGTSVVQNDRLFALTSDTPVNS